MASRDGRHVPGTPYRWRHGWKPRSLATAIRYRKGRHVIDALRRTRNRRHSTLGRPRPDVTSQDQVYKGRLKGSPTLLQRLRQKQDPLNGVRLEDLSDEQIGELVTRHPDRQDVFDRLLAEMERRDQTAADSFGAHVDEPTDEERRVADLVGKGWEYRDAYAEVHHLDAADLDRQERAAAVDAQRGTGETREQAVRRLYDEFVHAQWLAAEEATRGVLTRRGSTADPVSLFSGPAHVARANASEELKRWWTDHPRMTFTEFKADTLGRASDRRAARRTREGRSGREFGL